MTGENFLFVPKKNIRFVILLAGLLLTLHNIVPHMHGWEVITSNDNVLAENTPPKRTLLSGLFYIDLGEDHLEHVVRPETDGSDMPCQTTQQSFPAVEHFSATLEYISQNSEIINFPDRKPILNAPFFNTQLMRGPPMSA